MPNHVHGIIIIVGAPLVGALSVKSRMDVNDRAGTRPNDRAGTRPAPTTLGQIIGSFKSIGKLFPNRERIFPIPALKEYHEIEFDQ